MLYSGFLSCCLVFRKFFEGEFIGFGDDEKCFLFLFFV